MTRTAGIFSIDLKPYRLVDGILSNLQGNLACGNVPGSNVQVPSKALEFDLRYDTQSYGHAIRFMRARGRIASI